MDIQMMTENDDPATQAQEMNRMNREDVGIQDPPWDFATRFRLKRQPP